jgi:hypothetical protein
VLRADIQMYMKDSPDDWNVPGSFAYNALMVRIRWAIYGPLTFDDILKAAKGPAVAFVVGLVGAALCPESAGAGCLIAAGALARWQGLQAPAQRIALMSPRWRSQPQPALSEVPRGPAWPGEARQQLQRSTPTT